MKENFDPKDFASFNELPEGEKPDFKPVEGGFVKEGVIEDVREAERIAHVEKRLREKRVRIFTEIHVSGHCGREDLRDFIDMTKPEHIIPAHGGLDKTKALADLAEEMNYNLKKNVHLMQDGKIIKI